MIRDRGFHELSVGDVMERAGIERTIFYRHFDGLADMMLQASTEAVGHLYEAQVDLGAARQPGDLAAIRDAIQPVVLVYREHGPLLRAIGEAGLSDPAIKQRGDEIRRRFDELIVEQLSELPRIRANPPANLRESVRALNLLNEMYLREAFGREPRLSVEEAVQTLTEIWVAFIDRAPEPS